MARRTERFDHYLSRMAKGLSTDPFDCQAVIPDVDGGLIFALRDREGAEPRDRKGAMRRGGEGANRVVKLEHEPVGRFEKRTRFVKGKNPRALVDRLEGEYRRFVSSNPHPLLGFVGQDIREIVIRKGVELQEVWREHLVEGKTGWASHVLTKLDLRPGALYLTFARKRQTVTFRVSHREDPRLARGTRVLHVNHLALSVVEDRRAGRLSPFEEVERFVAYLLAHTTGPSTRITGYSATTPSVTLYGKEVEVNPFLPEGRQGASGMAAALFGAKRDRLKVVSFGDSSCRQTFPPFHSLKFFDTWSYFPVKMAPDPGSWAAFDFSEKEVVKGSEKKLEELLKTLKKENKDVKVALIQTCVSRLIGDDVKGVLRGALGKNDYVVLDPDFQARDAAVDSLVWPWALKAFAGKKKPPRRKNLVNLVGLGQRHFPATDELFDMLEGLGVGVNACLFPSFTEEELERFGRARATVASTCSIVRNAFSLAAKKFPDPPWLLLDPPFGLKQTRAWARSVLSQVKSGAALKKGRDRIDAEYRKHARALGPIKRKLKNGSVALVASSRFSAYLFDPAEMFGIRILDLLEELGLNAEIYIYEDIPPPRELTDHAAGRGNVELSLFDDPDALLAAVARSRAKLLLTSVRRNGFALSLGKVPLFVHAFEMGNEGALRTAERLARYVEFDFVDRYRRYFRA